MIELAALIIGSLTTSLLALIVFAKNSQSITNKLFIGLAVGLAGWSVTTYLSLHASGDGLTLFWIRWIMFFVVLQNTCFFFLVRVFPANQFNLFQKKRYVIAIAFSALTAITALSPLLFKDFQDGAPVPGPGMALFMPHAVIFALGGLIMLFVRYHSASGIVKAQLQYFLAGTLLMFTLVPVSNFILPVVFKQSQFVIFSPLYSIFFSGLIAYAIVTKKLFDIRAIAAKSAAYLLALGAIAVTYGVVVFGASQLFFGGYGEQNLNQAVVNIAFAIFLAFTFHPLKQFFDRLTNKIFYRDSYDSQIILNRTNQVLTTQIQLAVITKRCLQIICDEMKISHGSFVVTEKDKIYHTFNLGPARAENLASAELMHLNRDIISTDELETGGKLNLLQKFDWNISLRLATRDGVVGYILLGPKKSGNIYTTPDKRLLLILANELAVGVQNARSFEEIQQFNVTLQQKIDDATKQLKHANQKLKEIDEAKDEFVSMASHQLRTPLTVIKGYLSMLLEGDMGKVSKQQKETIQTAFDGAERMVFLIGDLLNVSRLQTGKFQIENKPTDLASVISHEVDHLQESAANHQLKLIFDKPKSFPSLMIDETKIRQVIMNFIDNAIYYTPAGGSITVKLESKDKSIEFTVNDTGLGVPKAEQHHLFSKFYRAGNARKMRPDGTGLGLYMAKKIVIAQGGAIIFRSEEGKGSTFGFNLPTQPNA